MPTNPYWTWCAAPGATKNTVLAVDTNAYGDGYEHRATRGLNPARPEFTLQFPFVGLARLSQYDDFLKQYAATGFWMLPPTEASEVFVVCDEWSANISDKNNTSGIVGTLSATFRRSFNPQPFNAPVNSYADAWRAKVSEQGGAVSEGQWNRVNRLATVLDFGDVLPRLAFLYLHVSESTVQNQVDLIRRNVGGMMNSPAWASTQGVGSDGATSYFDTKHVTADGFNYSQNDAMFGAWVSVPPPNTNRTSIGPNSTRGTRIVNGTLNAPYTLLMGVQNQTSGLTTLTVAARTGFMLAQRTSPTESHGYRNEDAYILTPVASGDLNTFPTPVLCQSTNAGALSAFFNGRVAASFAGRSLDANQRATLFGALRDYLSWYGVTP